MSGPTIKMSVDGLSDLEAALVDLGDAVGEKVLRSAGRESMQQVLDDAKRYAQASRDSGTLQDSLALAVSGYGKKRSLVDCLVTVRLYIRPIPKKQMATNRKLRGKYFANPRRYWHLIEWGTRHSGAKPFIRPAIDADSVRILESVRAQIQQKIERVKNRRARAST